MNRDKPAFLPILARGHTYVANREQREKEMALIEKLKTYKSFMCQTVLSLYICTRTSLLCHSAGDKSKLRSLQCASACTRIFAPWMHCSYALLQSAFDYVKVVTCHPWHSPGACVYAVSPSHQLASRWRALGRGVKNGRALCKLYLDISYLHCIACKLSYALIRFLISVLIVCTFCSLFYYIFLISCVFFTVVNAVMEMYNFFFV